MRVFVSVLKNSEVFNTFFEDNVRSYLENAAEVIYYPHDRIITPEEFRQYAANCDAVITGWGHPTITRQMVEGTSVKLIVHTGGSVGSLVDMELFDMGIRVISGNLLYAESVAEGVVAYMLMGLRRLPAYVQNVRDGGWRFENNHTKGLLDRSVGLIGVGSIARFLMQKLQVFNVKIKVYDTYEVDKAFLKSCNAEQVSLSEVLSCDIVSLHMAMNEDTRGMIGDNEFKLIRDGALFINTSRGRIVDEAAMIKELETGRFDAVLDVYHSEPLELNSPLRDLQNVYCVPHMAGPTTDRRPVITKRLIDNMLLFEKGEAMPLEISKQSALRMTVGG